MNTEKIGEYILKLRKKRGLTQEELANKIYVTNKAVSRWETGKSLPEIETLYLLSKKLGVSVNDILNVGIKDELEVKKYFDKKRTKNILLDIITLLLIIVLPLLYNFFISNYTINIVIKELTEKNIENSILNFILSINFLNIVHYIIYWILLFLSFVFYKLKKSKLLVVLFIICILIFLLFIFTFNFNFPFAYLTIETIMFLLLSICILIQFLILKKSNF